MLEKLQKLPHYESLKNYIEAIIKAKSDRIASLILFGSMTKGNYTKYSDFDLLVVVSKEEKSFVDRFYEYSLYSDGWVEPFVYLMKEIDYMFKSYNPFILDVLKDGIIIYDKGFWKGSKTKFEKLLKQGLIIPRENGWKINL